MNTTHFFIVEEAKAYGVEPAILLNNLRFWLEKNRANKKHIHDGYVWTYNSATAFSELFPYIDRRSISRHLKTLCDAGILKSACYNSAKYDRTLWYTITAEFATESLQVNNHAIGQNDLSIGQNDLSIGQNDLSIGQNVQPIPDINTDINTDIKNVVVTREKVFLNFDDLNADEKDCYHWAMTQPYWSSSTSSIDNFKNVYDKPSPKGLRAQFDAHKKALQDGLGQTGLNQSQNNSTRTGVNYATHNATNTKLCAADRIRNKAILKRAEAERAERECNASANDHNNIELADYEVHANWQR